MNDKIIIKAISSIYFTITSLLFFIFLTLCVVFVILQNGLYIESISLPNFKIKQLYIKWNEKLNISVKESTFILNDNKSELNLEPKDIIKIIKTTPTLYNIFESINIEKININNTTSSFKYIQGGDGYISFKSPDISFKNSIFFESNLLNVKIDDFYDKKRKIKLSGNIILDTAARTSTIALKLKINNEADIELLAQTDKKNFKYKINSLNDIKSIVHIMSLFNLYEELQFWACDAIDFSTLSIENAYGWGSYKNLDDAYKNLYVSAVGHDLTYQYNKDLDLIHTKRTLLEFKDGVLFIRPKQHYTYNSKLDKSWLKIDFTQKAELLTLHLLFDGKLDKPTLGILKAYKIDVPFLQNSGITNTDLTLKVDLRTFDVDAQGDFITKKSNFRYQGFDIDIFNSHINLNNYVVTINKMLAKYEDKIATDIKVEYNAKDAQGEIDFNIKKIDFKNLKISLSKENKILKAKYLISKNQDEISIDKSLWNINDYAVNIEKVTLPFNLEKQKLSIPSTLINFKNNVRADISGLIDFKEIDFKVDVNLLKFNFENIKITDKNTNIKLNYNKYLSISTKKRTNFKINSINSFLDKTTLKITNNILTVNNSFINIGDTLKTNLNLNYSIKKENGYIETSNFIFKDEILGSLYEGKEVNKFKISTKDNNFYLSSETLNILFAKTDNQWKFDINSLETLSKNSRLLRNYRLNKGNISIKKLNNSEQIRLTANVNYPYKILVLDNKEIENYNIQGDIDTLSKKVNLNINNSVNINIETNTKVDIKANNIGINAKAILDFISDYKPINDNNNSKLHLSIKAENSYIRIGKKRAVISELINLQYYNDNLTANLIHNNGVANLNYKKDTFTLQGNNFNDRFMEKLSGLSKFKGGQLNFNIAGTSKEYNGKFNIKDTKISDYNILNNILAFVNTVPSLLTFSLPGYSKNGLMINTGHLNFSSLDNKLNIKSIYIDSKEISIIGDGEANIVDNTIDLELSLKTDIGSLISKIPVVGYLIFNKDTISTNISITGELDNPDVTSLIAKDIGLAPINIIKRTLTLPYHLITDKNTSN